MARETGGSAVWQETPGAAVRALLGRIIPTEVEGEYTIATEGVAGASLVRVDLSDGPFGAPAFEPPAFGGPAFFAGVGLAGPRTYTIRDDDLTGTGRLIIMNTAATVA